MKNAIGHKVAGPLLGLTLGLTLLSSCMPAPLRAQRNAQVNVAAQPAGPGLVQSSFRSDVYDLPGPRALAVRTDKDAFVSVIVLPVNTGAWGQVPLGATVLEAVPVPGGVTSTVGLPGLPQAASVGGVQVFVVASVAPLNLGAARGVSTLKGVSQVVETAARTLPAGGYNVTSIRYRVAPFGQVTVASNVQGANVSVDGTLVGQTPFVTVKDVPAGPVEVKVQRAGFEPWVNTVNVRANAETQVWAHLRPALGRLVVSSSVQADVYVNGQPVGRGTSVNVRVPAGTVQVTVVPTPVPGQPTLNSSGAVVQVRADETASVTCGGQGHFVCHAR